jgi:hypothetical protein
MTAIWERRGRSVFETGFLEVPENAKEEIRNFPFITIDSGPRVILLSAREEYHTIRAHNNRYENS